ncbi:WG repeat-containing protein [Maribacter algicola]|uniref:WG repeat-containing protein n=1 Tax=Meishania litoralis TaxID=3434685 RepID=A0ACC7LHQ1_9FLAO
MKNISLLLVFSFVLLQTAAQELALVVDDGKVAYIDTSGKQVIQTDFKKAASFSNGLAAAQEEKKWGFIDSSGKWAIEPQYDRVNAFDSGLALVSKDDQWSYIKTSGEVLTLAESPDKYYDFNDGVALYRKGEKIGLLGTDGKLILEPTYKTIKNFWDGHAKISNGELWGLINAKGEIVIPAEYEEVGTYNKNGIWGRKGNDYGVFINWKFTPVPDATKIWDFKHTSDLTYAQKGEKIGFINNQGQWVIEASFDKARAFSNGFAPVMKDKKWGYIDEKGAQIVDFQYKDAETFSSDGLAPVKEKLWGFVDTTGKLVIPMEYDISVGFSFFQKNAEKGFINGLARVKTKKGWGYINTKGEVLGDKWYKNAELFTDVK